MSADDKSSSDAATGQRDFLSRWSQRKVEANQKPTIDHESIQAETLLDPAEDASTQLTSEDMEALSDEELLEHFDLPDPEALKQGDDFTVFMKSAIPARIRNRALRKLWLSNPVLANVDMLVDYGDDFTDAATVIPDMKTAYQVGKGIVRKIEELMGDDESGAAENDAVDSENADDSETATEIQSSDTSVTETIAPDTEAELVMASDQDSLAVDGSEPVLDSGDEEPTETVMPMRRMSFSLDG